MSEKWIARSVKDSYLTIGLLLFYITDSMFLYHGVVIFFFFNLYKILRIFSLGVGWKDRAQAVEQVNWAKTMKLFYLGTTHCRLLQSRLVQVEWNAAAGFTFLPIVFGLSEN